MTPKLYTALKWGALLGGALAIFETWGALSTMQAANYTDFKIANCLSLGLEALAPLVAGVLAGRATGERFYGLVAGLTAGLIVALINQITLFAAPIDSFVSQSGVPADTGLTAIVDTIFSRLITVGLGAWFGWLGGRLSQMTLPQSPPRPPRR